MNQPFVFALISIEVAHSDLNEKPLDAYGVFITSLISLLVPKTYYFSDAFSGDIITTKKHSTLNENTLESLKAQVVYDCR